MIIKKIEIENFRSYYKSNVFELVNGLNLIIGSNGDGKTTFYEALEWLFRTDGTSKADTKLISKKRSEELSADESDDVRAGPWRRRLSDQTLPHAGASLAGTAHFAAGLPHRAGAGRFAAADTGGPHRPAQRCAGPASGRFRPSPDRH